MKVLKALEGIHPKFAKHIFEKNKLIESFAMKAGGGFEILDRPVCEHCERVAAWDKEGTAYCFACNKKTMKPITVREYLLDQMKDVDEHTILLLNQLAKEDNEDEWFTVK